MSAREIPIAEWPEFLEQFSCDHHAWLATVDRMNAFSQTGRDDEFGRGSTVYQNHNGDASAGGANPNLGRIAAAPFACARRYRSL